METTFKRLEVEMTQIFIQFLQEEKLTTVVHRLEEDSRCCFDLGYIGSLVTEGDYGNTEKYISAFTKMEENQNTHQIFLVLRRQKYLEAFYNGDRTKARGMLENELKVFEASNQQLYADLKKIPRLRNFRNHYLFSGFEDTTSIRTKVRQEIEELISGNPGLRPKLQLPNIKNSRLRSIIHHSWSWQHMQCKNPKINPEFSSLFLDHSCDDESEAEAPPSFPYPGSVPINAPVESPLHRPPVPSELLNQQGTYPVSSFDNRIPYQLGSKKKSQKKVDNTQPDQNPQHNVDDLPLTVVTSVSTGSTVKSMDFHPTRSELLLVGTDTGDVAIWDLTSSTKLVQKGFTATPSMNLQKNAMADKISAEVNRVTWSSDGIYFGVAYSKKLLRLYSYLGGDEVVNGSEIDAHTGSVNDVALTTKQNNYPWAITCGDDRTVKVWDTFMCDLKFCFEGHEAPVYSVCPRKFGDREALFSADTDGVIKIWFYDKDDISCKGNLAAPHQIASKIAFSGDGTRMFLGGTSRENVSGVVEMSQIDGSIKHSYNGLATHSVGVVQYDIANDKYLAAVDDNLVKFWDVDHGNLLKTTTTGGGLPVTASACIKFNKEGTLLAVTTNSKSIKILADAAGKRTFRAMGKRTIDAPGAASSPLEAPCVSGGKEIMDTSRPSRRASPTPRISMPDENRRTVEGQTGSSRTFNMKEINEPCECRLVRLPNKFARKSVSCLAYTRMGRALLALGSSGEHRLWEWQKDAENPNGNATASFAPKLWQAPDGRKMINEVGYTNPDGYVNCFAIPKSSNCFVASASGGKVSVYDTTTFERIGHFMTPPPAATSLAIHPEDKNTLVVGMGDSSIQIYQSQEEKVLSTLSGHSKRVTGLAISDKLNVLVSSGADSQLCIWNIDDWKKVGSTFMQVPDGLASDTRVEFHKDQIRLLAVHKTKIAIYGAPDLCCLHQWSPPEVCSIITHAVYSCDCETIYTGFADGSVGVLTASSLEIRCRINPTSYVPENIKSNPYPRVLVAHPSEPNQMALGLSNGLVVVLEPLEEEGIWGTRATPL